MQDNPQMTTQITIDQLVELARQAEYKNPIDWGELPLSEDTIYATYARAVYISYAQTSPAYKDVVLLASIIKLHVENFVLSQTNAQLRETITKLSK